MGPDEAQLRIVAGVATTSTSARFNAGLANGRRGHAASTIHGECS